MVTTPSQSPELGVTGKETGKLTNRGEEGADAGLLPPRSAGGRGTWGLLCGAAVSLEVPVLSGGASAEGWPVGRWAGNAPPHA